MPRPTLPQLTYGFITVICTAMAMLMLSQAEAPLALLAICCTALALGLLVALTAPAFGGPRRAGSTIVAGSHVEPASPHHERVKA